MICLREHDHVVVDAEAAVTCGGGGLVVNQMPVVHV